MKTIKYKYKEDITFDKIKKYIDSTYGAHYVNQGLQVIDIWESRGTLMSTATDTAIKYLMRFSRKDGMNEKDLLKAIHYIMLMLYELDNKKGDVFNETHIRTDE
jgi:hypothetical protein